MGWRIATAAAASASAWARRARASACCRSDVCDLGGGGGALGRAAVALLGRSAARRLPPSCFEPLEPIGARCVIA
eukprot:scaffold263030_cov30-Tisochrysis_lutea.AAC.1